MKEKKQSLLNIRMELIIKFINDIQNYHLVRKILSKPPSCCTVLDSIIPGSKFYNLIHENNLKQLEKKKEQKKQKFKQIVLKQTEIDYENEQILANSKLYKFKKAKNPSCFGQKSFNKILLFFNGLNEMEFLNSNCKIKIFNLIKECLEFVINPFEIEKENKEKKFKFFNKKNENEKIECKRIFKNEKFNFFNVNEIKIFYNNNVLNKLNLNENNNFLHRNFDVNIINNNNNNFSENNNKNFFKQKAKNLKLNLNSTSSIKKSRNFISNLSFTTNNTKNNLKSINSNIKTTFSSNSKFKQFTTENNFFKEIKDFNTENNNFYIKNNNKTKNIFNNNNNNFFKYLNEKNIEKIKSKSNKKELKNIFSMNKIKFYDFNYEKLLNLRIHTKLKRPKTNKNNNNKENNNNNKNKKNLNISHSFQRKKNYHHKTFKI